MEGKTITSKMGIKFRVQQPNSAIIYVATNCQPSWIGQLHIISALQEKLGLEYSRHVYIDGANAMAYFLGSHPIEEVNNILETYSS